MKLRMDNGLISVRDVKTVFLNHKATEEKQYDERMVRVYSDPNWGLFKRKWYEIRSYLFGYPTKLERICIEPPKRWVVTMEYEDEDGKSYTFTASHETYPPMKKQFDQIIQQLPNEMASKVNEIMFEDEKK